MKKSFFTLAYSFFIASIILALVSCCSIASHNPNDQLPKGADLRIHYVWFKAVILEKGTNGDAKGKYFLIRGVQDTTLFTELTGNNFNGLDGNAYSGTDSLYYNKNIGDTLYFDYIKKDRFWHGYNYKPRHVRPDGWR